MRIQAMQRAKGKNGKWETAAKAELVPEPGVEAGPAGIAAICS